MLWELNLMMQPLRNIEKFLLKLNKDSPKMHRMLYLMKKYLIHLLALVMSQLQFMDLMIAHKYGHCADLEIILLLKVGLVRYL